MLDETGILRPMPTAARALHVLDIGTQQYGDCLLFESGAARVLIDGGHKGDQDLIYEQLKQRVPQSGAALHLSLLVVTHAHGDHIGALPSLVADGRIAADWALVADPDYGWGRSIAGATTPLDSVSDAVGGLVAALHEEPPPPSLSDAELRQFIADAAGGEDTYKQMLDALGQQGTRVVRHGRDSETALLAAFRAIGLEIYGPTKAHLQAASGEVLTAQRVALAAAGDALRSDALGDPVNILRRLVASSSGATDAMTDALADAQSRNGAAVNCQSTVIGLKAGTWRALLGGDMQFALSVPAIEPHVRALRERLRQAKPFHLFKLSHHGSSNGWDKALYDEIGKPKYLAISLGLHKGHHPDPSVLSDLRSLPNVTWGRSDLNGHVRFSFASTKIAVSKTRGQLNDDTPPEPDAALVPTTLVAAPRRDVGEIVTRAPYGVPVTITIGQRGAAGSADVQAQAAEPATALPQLNLFGGRDLPRLLFVTSRDALADRLGIAETSLVLDGLRKKGVLLFDELPAGVGQRTAQSAVLEAIARAGNVRGVVLIGGYSVVPSQRLFCLPPELQDRVSPEEDSPDGFLVWSDDFYTDTSGDGHADLPISRVPDGRSPELVFMQLQASGRPRAKRRVGIRNSERPFADDVFRHVPGTGTMLLSAPANVENPPHLIDGDVVYLMLHGADLDGTVFYGQLGHGSPSDWPVVAMSTVPSVCGPLVFTGCCWGALITARPASQTPDGSPMASRTTDQSLALRILRSGATAFIGVTGTHYSPNPPGTYHGGAMHHAFFRNYQPGASPAQTLFAAKADFRANIPHGQEDDAFMAAVDVKIYAEYTCLGLGW